MEENLVGYLLGALEPEEQTQIETYLEHDPSARHHLERLRQALEPLAVDADSIEPPAGLWVRTLARVAEHRCRHLSTAPDVFPFRPSPSTSHSWWRRADIAVAAAIIFILLLLVPPAISTVRNQYTLSACQNNLRLIAHALGAYSDQHDGKFPDVANALPAPRNVAGLYIPILIQNRVLPEGFNPACPTSGVAHVPGVTLDQVRQMTPEEFAQYLNGLGACYAYSLGYRDQNGNIHGLRINANDPAHDTHFPILADAPPADINSRGAGNSASHQGRGQNVLYLDGHCAFCTVRTVGVNGDDIYVNFDREVAAGKSNLDAVLAQSGYQP